jgi:hypothetical protein
MAGNYRSSNSGIASSVGRLVKGARATHEKKQTLRKQVESAKEILTHRAAMKAHVESVRAKGRIDAIKARGSEQRRTATHKNKLKGGTTRKNDLDFGKKNVTVTPKKRRLGKDKKW